MDGTKRNKMEHWEKILRNLKLWEIRLIQLRVEGHTYENISQILKKELPKIKQNDLKLRKMLTEKGRLRPSYDAYRKMVAEENVENSLTTLRLATHAASVVEVSLLKSSQDHVKLNASEAILDRVLGKAIPQVETRDDSEVEELTRLIKEFTAPNENIRKLSAAIKRGYVIKEGVLGKEEIE